MATEHDILVAARDLISDPARWTQGVNARTERGRQIGPETPGAICYCANGAIQKITLGRYAQYWRACAVLNASASWLYAGLDFIDVNDRYGHAAILKVFDHAITKAAPPAAQEV